MTRWQKFGWALGYSLLMALLTLAFIHFGYADHWLGAPVTIYLVILVVLIALGEAAFIWGFMIACLLIAVGLVLAPVFAAFRRYLPLYLLMGVDAAGRLLLLMFDLKAGDMGGLLPGVIGLALAVWLLLLTLRLFRYPEPGQAAPEEKDPKWYRRRERFHHLRKGAAEPDEKSQQALEKP